MGFVQVIIFGQIHPFNFAFCFAYITVLISLPASNGMIVNLLIAVVMGAFVDAYNYTMGINAFAALTLMYFRLNIFGFIKHQTKEEQLTTSYTLKGIGTWNFTLFVIFSTLFYTTIFYFLMAPGVNFLLKNILRIIFSTILTSIVIVCINFLFFRKEHSI
jgi:hypothetical protein